MAPRKSNASVKSSGSTSKKAAPLPDWVKNGGKPPPTSTEPITTTFTRRDGTVVTQTHLFPPNTKTPINLLHERITKTTDWAKPDLRPHPLPGSSKSEFTCTIILTKPNKTDASKPHRIEIKPPMRAGQGGALDGLFFSCDSSEKAKHWGATFALFRLYSNQQFGRMLPTLKSSPGGGPREYWQQMENWLKSTEAKSWLSRPENADYLAPDPFEALATRERQQKERLVKEAARASEIEKGLADPLLSDNGKSGPRISKAWAEAREVRMAPALRELVERTIRGAMQVFGNMIEENGDEVDGADGIQGRDQQAKQSITFEADVITKALSSQGFRPAYVRTAIDWLRSASNLLSKDGSDAASSLRDPLIASLRSKTLSPLEATIQYLLLYVPEEDLPMRFRPSKASDGFVSTAIAANETTSVSDGDNLAWRWTEAALVKEYKWPRKPTANAVQTIREWRQQLLADESRLTSTSSLKDMSASSRLAMVVDVLLAQLGEERADLIDSVQQVLEHAASAADATKQDWEEIQSRRADERIAIEAVLGEERLRPVEGAPDAFDIALAAFPGSEHSLPKHAQKEDLWLRILPHRLSLYPSERRPKSFPTFTVISRTLPSYLCLALTKRLVKVLTTKPDFTDILEAGQGGAILSMVEELDAGWWGVLEQPPTLDSVMAGLIAQEAPKDSSGDGESGQDGLKPSPKKGTSGPQRLAKPLRKEQKIDEELWAQHQQLLERSDHQEMLRARRSLPAFASRNEILSYLSSSSALSDPSCEFAGRVLIVAGETGCGKSTQVPQFILEDAIDRKEGSLCNIVVTQPRRVSAMGLAARVAAERGEEWVDEDARGDERGNIVGYAIRGERRASRQTRLLFTTTGVLLRRLSSGTDPDLQSISHVVVDEVHERSLDSDFLLLELRELLRRNNTIKLILMSATIEQELFVKYFGNAPCLEIPGRTYPVQDHYIEDIINDLSGWKPSASLLAAGKAAEAQQRKRAQAQQDRESTPGTNAHLKLQKAAAKYEDDLSPQEVGYKDDHTAGSSASTQTALKGLRHSDRIDFELLGSVVKHVIERAELDEARLARSEANKGGAILIFCPGVGEIRQAIDAINRCVTSKIDVLPLHANLSPAEQRRVFQRPKLGHRKVVVSTNVAETSITIDDISYVVDTGRVKETRFDPERGLTSLVEGWASRAACKQRRGRAGRVRAGSCFKLFTRQTELDKQPKQTTPEMLRVSLENVFLQAKAMHDEVDLRDFLSRALSPPRLASMQSALQNLIECGAMRSDRGFSSRLTALGRHLANLPLDIRLGKLILFGALFGVLGPALSVASIMSSKPLFISPERNNDAIASSRKSFAVGNSDLLTDAYAFNAWLARRASKSTNTDLRKWCEANNLSQAALRDVYALRFELLGNLQDLGFARQYRVNAILPEPSATHTQSQAGDLQAADCNVTNLNMLRAILAASLWPSIIRIQMPAPNFKESAAGALLKDPEARTIKYFDRSQGRLFMFGTSVCFDAISYSSSYMAVFSKALLKQSGPPSGPGAVSSREKVMMRDANEVPLYSLLLFGGKLKVNHATGGISIGSAAPVPADKAVVNDEAGDDRDGWVKVRASGRIAVLCSQLRALLDAVLENAIENPSVMSWDTNPDTHETRVLKSIVALLTRDGL